MKRLHIIFAIQLCFWMCLSTSAVGQHQHKNKYRYHKKQSKPEECSSQKERHHQNHHYKYPKKCSNHYDDYQSVYHRQHNHYKRHSNKREGYCSSSRINDKRYCKNLPSRQYVRIRFGNETFYYCNGLFYVYKPKQGYHTVEQRMQSIKYKPQHCSLKMVHGKPYYYKRGYYYIPNSEGRFYICKATHCSL